MPNLSRQAHVNGLKLEISFMRSAFLETADQSSQSDYRPIVIGAPLEPTPSLISKPAESV